MRGRVVTGMGIGETSQTVVSLRRCLAHLLLLAFVVRALVPSGYMPDFSAASEGLFKVVICSAMGAKTIALDDSGKPVPDPINGLQDLPCAFAGMAAVVLPALAAIQRAAPEFEDSNLDPRLAVQLPPIIGGPQLGSRGPPQIL